MSNTTHTDLPAFLTNPPPRKRRSGPRRMPKGEPVVRLLADGKHVAVSLFGARGEGREVILPAADWTWIADRVSSRWVVNASGSGYLQIRCGSAKAATTALQPGERPTATLARVLTGAKRGEVVRYLDGNPFNLRRANLEVLSKAEAARRRWTQNAS